MNVLLDTMLSNADPSQVAGLSRFFKTGPGQYGEGDKFLGIKVPVTRAVVKDCWRKVDFPELEECIASEYHEVRLAALLTLVEIFKHSKPSSSSCHSDQRQLSPSDTDQGPSSSCHSDQRQFPPSNSVLDRHDSCHSDRSAAMRRNPLADERPHLCVDFYLSHLPFINNWDLVDLSCYPLLGEWLLDKDRSVLYDLARSGKTIWEQRIGIVSTMTFIRHGQLEDTFAIADILLHHHHDLIHKAVGWLLREAGKRDKAALVAFLRGADPSLTPDAPRHATGNAKSNGTYAAIIPAPDLAPRFRTMPRTALRYAIEKFPEAERKAWMNGTIQR